MVIAVGDGVDDRLSDGVRRKFVGGRCSDAGSTGADGAVDLAKHEIPGLIGLVEEIAAVHLQGGKRAAVLRAVAVDALGLGGAVESLRIGAEQQHGGICRFSLFQQIEVGKQRLRSRVGLEREAAFSAGGFQKPVDTFAGQMLAGWRRRKAKCRKAEHAAPLCRRGSQRGWRRPRPSGR